MLLRSERLADDSAVGRPAPAPGHRRRLRSIAVVSSREEDRSPGRKRSGLRLELVPTPLVAAQRVIEIARPSRPTLLRNLRNVLLVGRWAAVSLALRLLGRLDSAGNGVRLRRLLEAMGGMWMKVGQLLGMRRDLLGNEFCNELSKLQDSAVGYPVADLKEMLEQELGGPLARTFSEFSELPIAAASIGQVHRALLRREQAWVAVKVQRPFIVEAYRQDMALIRATAWLCARVLPYARWQEMVWELERMLYDELDYRVEASSIQRMRANLRKHKVYVPKVFFAYSTGRLLVMEFVDGVFMSDYIKMQHADRGRLEQWRRENGVDPKVVHRRLYNSLSRQVFEDNLFHGDLHPGNVVLLRRSRLALIDFGAVGSLEESFRKKYAQFHRSLSEREYAKAVEAVLLLSSALPHVDVEEVKRKLVRYFQAWEVRAKTKALPYHEKSISSVMNGMAEIMGEYKLPPSWEFLRLTRTFFAVDISLNELCEHVNVVRSIRRYWRAAGQRDWQLLQARIWSERNVHNVMTSQIELAEAVSETTMYATEVMRRRALSFAATAGKFATLFEAGLRIVRWALVAVGIWLLAALLAQLAPAVLTRFGQQDLVRLAGRLPRLGWAGWVAVFVVFASLFKMTVRLVRKFAERETPLVQDVRT